MTELIEQHSAEMGDDFGNTPMRETKKPTTVQQLLDPATNRALTKLGRELSPPENRGEFYQHRFEATLEALQKRREIWRWEATKKDSLEDKNQIDYWLHLKGEDVPVQIKGDIDNSHKAKQMRELAGMGIVAIEIPENGIPKPVKKLYTEVITKLRERDKNRTDKYITRATPLSYPSYPKAS